MKWYLNSFFPLSWWHLKNIPSFHKSLPILSYTLLELWSNLEEQKKKNQLLQASFMMSYNILEQRLIFHTFGIDYPQCLAIYHNYFSFYFLLIKKKKKNWPCEDIARTLSSSLKGTSANEGSSSLSFIVNSW